MTASDLALTVSSAIKSLDLLDRVSFMVRDEPKHSVVYVTIEKFDWSGLVHFRAYCVVTEHGWQIKVTNVASGETFACTLDAVLAHCALN
jgi:hypothetical protein